MTEEIRANRWRRFEEWDTRPLRLDSFADEDDDAGFKAFSSRNDPLPSLTVDGGHILAMDGVRAEDFDLIDAFIAAHHIDLSIAPEAMAMDARDVARMLVDINVSREPLERLARGMTPAKLAAVVSH
nr:glycerol dehydratase [Hyphomicrobiales bacterium]